jgi:murein DD-endopeptidase MepM/ murein hydrolase activator NlpD
MKLLLISALLFSPALARADHRSDAVQVSENKGRNQIVIHALNTDDTLVRWVQVQLQNADNISADRPLPARAVLQPGQGMDLMVLRVSDPSRGASYTIASSQGFGNPDVQPDMSVAYVMPFEHGSKHCVTQGYLGTVTHQGLYALDFDLAQGTTICAARDGVVATVKQDSDTGGMSTYYASMGNYIDILHDDGTWSTYAHIELNGSLVREGDRVKAGDPIALSGATGEASGPHLHFSVQKARWDGDPETYATPFMVDETETAFLTEGGYYYSWHPGGAPFDRVFAASIDQAALEQRVTPVSGGKVRFREEKIDNMAFLYCANPLASPIELKVDFAQSQNVQASKDLPFSKIVPAQSEVFLMSVLMKGQSSYQTSFSYRPLP